MKPERSLPHLQKTATCPYHQPDSSGPAFPSHSLKVHFNIIF